MQFDAAMHSVTSAQFQVDLWIKKKDIYTDKIYWRNDVNGKITYDRPGLHHYLPPNFAIPVPPRDLPEDIPLMTSSSEDSADEGWMLRYEERRRKKKEQDVLLKLALNSRADGDGSDSDSSSSTESRSLLTGQSTTSGVEGGMQQFLHVARQSMIAAASASTERASGIGFESSSVPLAEVATSDGAHVELSRISGQAFSVDGESAGGEKKESDEDSDSSSGSGDSGSEAESGATISKATSSVAQSAAPSQTSQSEAKSTARTLPPPVAADTRRSEVPDAGADMSQSVITFTGAADEAQAPAGAQFYGSALEVSQSQSQSLEHQDQQYFYDQSQKQQLQVYDPNEQYTQYWDEPSQQYLYWDNVNQQYQYWDEAQQQYLIYDAYEQAVVPAAGSAEGGAVDGDGQQQLVVPVSARSSVSTLPPLLLTERPQSGMSAGGKVLVQRPPRYDFRRKMAEFSVMFDENEEEYVGVPDSLTTTKLQEAVALARDYIKNNSLYLQRQQLLAIGGGQVKNQSRRKSAAADKKALAHQAIDLYAKPSNLGKKTVVIFMGYHFPHKTLSQCPFPQFTDDEAAIVKQKAFQEYEAAFKAIRKVTCMLCPRVVHYCH